MRDTCSASVLARRHPDPVSAMSIQKSRKQGCLERESVGGRLGFRLLGKILTHFVLQLDSPALGIQLSSDANVEDKSVEVQIDLQLVARRSTQPWTVGSEVLAPVGLIARR